MSGAEFTTRGKVAVIRLDNASGLQTARLGSSSGASVGDAVTAIGNEQVAVRCSESVAVHDTFVVPTLKTDPD